MKDRVEKVKGEITYHTTEGEKVTQQATFLKVWGKLHGKKTKKTIEMLDSSKDTPEAS